MPVIRPYYPPPRLVQAGNAVGDALAARALKDASNILVLPPGSTGASAPRGLLAALSDLRSLKTYATGDGATTDQAGLVQAFANAASGAWELNAGNGAYVSTDTIPNLHAVKVSGQGSIKRGAGTFYFNPLPDQRNTLFISPAGTGDGLSAAQPMSLQAAFDALKIRSPLPGLWTIALAAGTYPAASLSPLVSMTFPLRIQGPNVGGFANSGLSNIPTAIIDGTGNASGNGLDFAGGHEIDLRDVKVQNFTGGGDAIRAAGGNITFRNVHWFNNQTNCNMSDLQQYAFVTGCLIDGNNLSGGYGILSLFHAHVTANFQGQTDLTLVPKIKNCAYGIWGQESVKGHLDNISIEDCGVGINGQSGTRFNTQSMRIWRCGTGVVSEQGCEILDNVIDFGEGTANACGTKWRFSGAGEYYRWRDTLELRRVNGIGATNIDFNYNANLLAETPIWTPMKIKAGDIGPVFAGTIAGVNYNVVHKLKVELGFIVSATQGQNVQISMYLGSVAATNQVAYYTLNPGAVGTYTELVFNVDIESVAASKALCERKSASAYASIYVRKNAMSLRSGSDVPVIITATWAAADTGAAISLRRGSVESTFGRCPY